MKVHGVELDLFYQVNRYYFKDKFGFRYICLKILPSGGLQLQCISRLNNGSVFCTRPEAIRLKENLRGIVEHR